MQWSNLRGLRSLRGRLFAAYAIGMLLTAALATLAFTAIFTWQADLLVRHGLNKAAHQVARRVELDASGRPVKLVLPARWQWLYDELPQDVEFRVVDGAGNALPVIERAGLLLPPSLRLESPLAATMVDVLGRTVHVVSVRIEQATGSFYLQVASSDRLAALGDLLQRKPTPGVVLTVVVSIPVLCALVLLVLGTLLRPLRDASTAAARIDARNLSTRLSTRDSPLELVPLIDAFNLALERLEQGYRLQQQFLGAAAHELKTPLALMRGQIELDGTADRQTLLSDIDLMARHVQQLLHLAEVSDSRSYKLEAIAVAEVADDVLSFLSRMADRNEVQLDLQLPSEAVSWRGDGSALFTLLKNLVENAIQHSPRGGVVTLLIDGAGLSVSDEGPGIAPAHAAHVFERFWRGSPDRDAAGRGAGLGLSICQEIAVAQGWSLGLRDVPRGASFRLSVTPGAAANLMAGLGQAPGADGVFSSFARPSTPESFP
ncbi:MAG TPA: ATP-binding protein [Burkholderiaceae bacterium]|jgi:signal transduction histidine kinase